MKQFFVFSQQLGLYMEYNMSQKRTFSLLSKAIHVDTAIQKSTGPVTPFLCWFPEANWAVHLTKVYLKSESSNIELGRLDKLLTLWSLSNVLLTFRIFWVSNFLAFCEGISQHWNTVRIWDASFFFALHIDLVIILPVVTTFKFFLSFLPIPMIICLVRVECHDGSP